MSDETSNAYEGLTKTAFDVIGWPALLVGAPLKESSEYAKLFSDKSKTLEESGQTEAARAARVLAEICSYAFRPNEQDRAFHPLIVWDGKRSALPEDLPGELIQIIALLAAEAGDAEFTASSAMSLFRDCRRKTKD